MLLNAKRCRIKTNLMWTPLFKLTTAVFEVTRNPAGPGDDKRRTRGWASLRSEYNPKSIGQHDSFFRIHLPYNLETQKCFRCCPSFLGLYSKRLSSFEFEFRDCMENVLLKMKHVELSMGDCIRSVSSPIHACGARRLQDQLDFW